MRFTLIEEIGTIDANGNATFYDGPVYNLADKQTSGLTSGLTRA